MSSTGVTRKIMQRILADITYSVPEQDIEALVTQALLQHDELAVNYLGSLIFQEREALVDVASFVDEMVQQVLNSVQVDISGLEQELETLNKMNTELSDKSQALDVLAKIESSERMLKQKRNSISQLENEAYEIQQEIMVLETNLMTSWGRDRDGANDIT